MESLLTENEVSACLKVSLACLRRWRLQGDGPQYVKVNNIASRFVISHEVRSRGEVE
ncbi:MAG: hypothetical protein WA400_17220 [Silvibacterium sp.]